MNKNKWNPKLGDYKKINASIDRRRIQKKIKTEKIIISSLLVIILILLILAFYHF